MENISDNEINSKIPFKSGFNISKSDELGLAIVLKNWEQIIF
jgi:hypothetical protein